MMKVGLEVAARKSKLRRNNKKRAQGPVFLNLKVESSARLRGAFFLGWVAKDVAPTPDGFDIVLAFGGS